MTDEVRNGLVAYNIMMYEMKDVLDIRLVVTWITRRINGKVPETKPSSTHGGIRLLLLLIPSSCSEWNSNGFDKVTVVVFTEFLNLLKLVKELVRVAVSNR